MRSETGDGGRREVGHAGRGTILRWGATLRCPRCGQGKLFERYFTLVDDCPGCGLHFEREQGYFAGALAVNIILVGAVFFVAFMTAIITIGPADISVLPMLAVLVPVTAIGPVVFYPVSKTLWMAVDRAYLQRLDRAEMLDERVR